MLQCGERHGGRSTFLCFYEPCILGQLDTCLQPTHAVLGMGRHEFQEHVLENGLDQMSREVSWDCVVVRKLQDKGMKWVKEGDEMGKLSDWSWHCSNL